MAEQDHKWANCCEILRDHLDNDAKAVIAHEMRILDPHQRFLNVFQKIRETSVHRDARDALCEIQTMSDEGETEEMLNKLSLLRERIASIPGAQHINDAQMKYHLIGASKNQAFSEYIAAVDQNEAMKCAVKSCEEFK